MDVFLVLLMMASLVFLIIGLFKPAKALFWLKGERTRKKSALLYTGLFVATIIGIGIIAPKDLSNQADQSKVETEEKPKAEEKQPANRPLPAAQQKTLTQKEINYALAKSPDTIYSYQDDFNNKPGYDSGYLIYRSWNTHYQTENWLYKKNWTIPSLRKTKGFSYDHFDEDREHMVSANIPVRVLEHYLECNTKRGGWNGAILVSPLGTSESFYVGANDFTLKDYKKLSLLMKSKCGFLTKVAYIPPTDSDKLPLVPDQSAILKLPQNPILILKDYNHPSGRAYCEVFNPRTRKELDAGLFDFSTLKEVE